MLQSFINLVTRSLGFVFNLGAQNAITVGSTIIKPLLDYSMGCTNTKARIAVQTSNNRQITTHVRKPIPRKLRDNVWIKYHANNSIGNCYCCGISINRYNGGWHCSHVIADAREGDITIDNLRTCCGHCNLSMGNQNLYAYIHTKNLQGPGAKNTDEYFRRYPELKDDKRTNNYGRKAIVTKLNK